MKDLIVIMPCTSPAGYVNEYLLQLARAQIDVYVDRLESFSNMNGGGTHAFAIEFMRRWASKFRDYKKIVFSDAFDVLFYGTKEDVLRKIPDDHILLAAERNCYPDISLARHFPGRTAWRFVNCGLTAGTPDNILNWLEQIEKHPLYLPNGLNQRMLNWLRRDESPLAPIDDMTELFYCLFLEKDELVFEDGLPKNSVLGTHPNFIHANGKWAMRRP